MRFASRFRQSEYTGENRCFACTVVNLAVVVVLAAFAGLFAAGLAPVVLVVGGGIIWLRGYVIPYTPTFAPRLVASVPLINSLFSHPSPGQAAEGLGRASIDVDRLLAELIDADVLVGTEDLQIESEFHAEWRETMPELRRETIASDVETSSPWADNAKYHTDGDDAWVIVTDDEGSVESEQWLPLPMAYADVAAVRTLETRGIDPALGAAAAAPLRLFLEACPVCGGELVETTAGGCCGGYGPGGPDHVLACESCDQWLAILDD